MGTAIVKQKITGPIGSPTGVGFAGTTTAPPEIPRRPVVRVGTWSGVGLTPSVRRSSSPTGTVSSGSPVRPPRVVVSGPGPRVGRASALLGPAPSVSGTIGLLAPTEAVVVFGKGPAPEILPASLEVLGSITGTFPTKTSGPERTRAATPVTCSGTRTRKVTSVETKRTRSFLAHAGEKQTTVAQHRTPPHVNTTRHRRNNLHRSRSRSRRDSAGSWFPDPIPSLSSCPSTRGPRRRTTD